MQLEAAGKRREPGRGPLPPLRLLALTLVALLGLGAGPRRAAAQATPKNAVVSIRVTVTVLDSSGAPVRRADVVLRQDTVDQGRLPRHPFDVELHTDRHGQVTVQGFAPGIVLVQVIANGFQTYGQAFIMSKANEYVHVQLQPPQRQVSSFQ